MFKKKKRKNRRFGPHPLLTYLQIWACVLAASAFSACQSTQPRSHEPVPPGPHPLLYIVDSDRGTSDSREHLFVLDPARKRIVRTYPTGAHPDIALSPDATRLYVASESRAPEGPDGAGTGRLDIFDTATGSLVASVGDPYRWIAMGPFYRSEMALSSDGRWLYVPRLTPGRPEGRQKEDREEDRNEEVRDHEPRNRPENTPQHHVFESVAIFDTLANKFLPNEIPFSNCGAALLLTWPKRRALTAVCSGTEDLRTMQLSDEGIPLTALPAVIPIPHDWGRTRLATAFISGENELTVFMTDGKFRRIDVQSGTTLHQGEIAFSPPLTPAGWHPSTPGAENAPSLGRRVIGWRILRSQGRLYVPLSRSDLYMHAADAVAVLDSRTFQQRSLLELKSSRLRSSWNLFWDGAIGDDGRRLYLLGIESKEGSVRVLSLPDGKEIDTIRGLGKTLSIVVGAP